MKAFSYTGLLETISTQYHLADNDIHFCILFGVFEYYASGLAFDKMTRTQLFKVPLSKFLISWNLNKILKFVLNVLRVGYHFLGVIF